MPVEIISPVKKLTIPARYRDSIKLLFIAKHALGDGSRDTVDGDHAVYHREVRDTLEKMGLNVEAANNPEVLFTKPDVDFVFSLLNRGGYLNSELLIPTLCTRLGIAYLGATPILRGLSDDKHLMKMAARARGVPTADSAIFRRGAPVDPITDWSANRYVVKPNASSASWGVSAEDDWTGVKRAIKTLHDEGHDALVDPRVEPVERCAHGQVPRGVHPETRQGLPGIGPAALGTPIQPPPERHLVRMRRGPLVHGGAGRVGQGFGPVGPPGVVGLGHCVEHGVQSMTIRRDRQGRGNVIAGRWFERVELRAGIASEARPCAVAIHVRRSITATATAARDEAGRDEGGHQQRVEKPSA